MFQNRPTSYDLTKFGIYLLNNDRIGYGLLVLIGSHMGIKMKHQLKLSWGDFISKDGVVKDSIKIKGDIERKINGFLKRTIVEQYKAIKPKTLKEPIFAKPSGDRIVIFNLKVDLNRYYKDWQKDEQPNKPREFKIHIAGQKEEAPIRPQDLEHAWARDYVFSNNSSVDAIKKISKDLKHSSVSYTIELLGLYPKEQNLDYKFNYAEHAALLGTDMNVEYMKLTEDLSKMMTENNPKDDLEKLLKDLKQKIKGTKEKK